MKFFTTLSAFTLALATSATIASAEPKKLNVDFGFFPKGTSCKIHGTNGRVKLKVGREIEYNIRGNTGNVSFRCQQPNGAAFTVHTGPLLPPGDLRMVSIQINQDNHAHVLWDQGGLRKKTVANILNWE